MIRARRARVRNAGLVPLALGEQPHRLGDVEQAERERARVAADLELGRRGRLGAEVRLHAMPGTPPCSSSTSCQLSSTSTGTRTPAAGPSATSNASRVRELTAETRATGAISPAIAASG